MKVLKNNPFFKDLRYLILGFGALGFVMISLLFPSANPALSFLVGTLLGYLNLFTLRDEGERFVLQVYRNVIGCIGKPYQRQRTLFIIKTYLRLLAIGLLFYLFITWMKLHPLFILMGFSLVYLQIFLLVFWYTLRKKEIA